jgi:pimeloyl-ACP methyl ester carboxylesterase
MRSGSFTRCLCLAGSLLLVASSLSACSLARFATLRENLRDLNSSVSVTGWLPSDGLRRDRIAVMALATGSEGRSRQLTMVFRSDFFFFRVPVGAEVVIVAFVDRNDNGVLDDGEAWSAIGPIVVKAGAPAIDVGRLPSMAHGDVPVAWRALNVSSMRTAPIAQGELTTLGDPRFSLEVGAQGLWAPMDFLRRQGMGVFLLQPHVRNRTPVVFVAGAGGAPIEWKNVIESLDPERFEPWLFLYPSGLRLEDSAKALCGIVGNLQKRMQVARVDVVAHSMGGLVARDCLRQSAESPEPSIRVRHFVALATPWDGHGGAYAGVKYAPAAVPAWYDLVPDSTFLRRLFSLPLPEGVSFTLMYANRGSDLESSDGVISLASARSPAAVHQAGVVAGFRADHSSILISSLAIDMLRQTLGGQ